MRKIILILLFMTFLYLPVANSTAQTLGDTNIRFEPCLGIRPSGVDYDISDGWLQNEYDKHLKKISDDLPHLYEGTNLCVLRKITWRDFYVDPTLAPTSSTQAQNPNWENYKWNQDDTIMKNLQDDLITSGKLKMVLLVADQSSAQAYAPPQWFINKGSTYGDRVKTFQIKLYKDEAVDHLSDFYIALLKKYGTEENLLGLVLGEYYTGDSSRYPNDFNRNGYIKGKMELWEKIVPSAPLDSNGNRIAIYQTNPLFSNDVTPSDMLRIGIGTSRSDIRMFKSGCGQSNEDVKCDEGSLPRFTQDTFGKIPHMINGDSKFARVGSTQTWSGIDNPFGHREGYKAVATPQEILWYHSSKGVVHINSLFLKIDNGAPPQTDANFFDAVKKFGPGGTLSSQWGSVASDGLSSCYEIDSGDSVQEGFAPPYDIQTNRLYFKGSCNSNSVDVSIGSSDITYVYENAYHWNGNSWIRVKLSGNNVGGSVWIADTGTTTLNLESDEPKYVLSYVCKWDGDNWKCGCRDSICTSSYWSLQIFNSK